MVSVSAFAPTKASLRACDERNDLAAPVGETMHRAGFEELRSGRPRVFRGCRPKRGWRQQRVLAVVLLPARACPVSPERRKKQTGLSCLLSDLRTWRMSLGAFARLVRGLVWNWPVSDS